MSSSLAISDNGIPSSFKACAAIRWLFALLFRDCPLAIPPFLPLTACRFKNSSLSWHICCHTQTVATNDIAFYAPWCLAPVPTNRDFNGAASNCCQTKTSLNRNAIERPKILSATQTSTSLPSCTIGF